MNNKNQHISFLKFATAIFLMAALSWLTVSIPFVYQAKQQTIKNASGKADNPFAGTTEEKTPSNPTVNINEEFLHNHHHDFSHIPFQITVAYIHAHESIYTAYHGEILCPPPDFS